MITDPVSIFLHDHGNHIHDHGPHYYEFHEDLWIKEPWNAGSSVFFLVPVIYWYWRLRGQYKDHRIMMIILPFLAINGIGSTLYHAFRNSDVFLIMDGAPAAIMSLIVTYYFWYLLFPRWYIPGLILLGSFVLRGFMFWGVSEGVIAIPRQQAVNLSYFITGVMIILPTLMILLKTRWYKWELIFASVILLSLALLFRVLDTYDDPGLPMGTHWLWHIVSAFSVFTLGYYLVYLKRKELKPYIPKRQKAKSA